MKIPKNLQIELLKELGKPITSEISCDGGCISNASAIVLEDGRKFFIKWNDSVEIDFFNAENEGLTELGNTGAIKVPKVFCLGQRNDALPGYIVMEYLNVGRRSTNEEVELGRSLAELHSIHADNFGFRIDNYIGKLRQINSEKSNWGEFYFENRLKVQIELGREQGWCSEGVLNNFLKMREKFVAILNEYDESPTLLHGDLWSGNVFWSDVGAVLIDPAIYYGNREADLAFSEMFGGFSKIFYKSYNDAFPLDSGYHNRKQILNLYHLLTHANLFGGSYIASFKNSFPSLLNKFY